MELGAPDGDVLIMVFDYFFFFCSRRQARIPLRIVPDDVRPQDWFTYSCAKIAHGRQTVEMQTMRQRVPWSIQLQGMRAPCILTWEKSEMNLKQIQSLLQIHTKTHEGEKCYKCDLCPYASISARHLESHMLVHTDQKPYQCKQCDQAFR